MELEASTIHSPGALSPPRIAIGPRLLRLRSDEQLVALFRSGHDEAFQVIYDRYHKRLAGYARQMLPRGHDPEDVLQDVFVRAYRALRHDDRDLAVRPWLFRVAHNCCIDELRRNVPAPTDEVFALISSTDDPAARVDARERLRRLIEDIGRLPEQQRSALLLRELSGISYSELAVVLETTVPAVKSLLVRARMGLVRADAARDTACSDIREQLTLAHDQGVRATPTVRRHLQDCPSCRSYRGQMCAVNKRMAALVPAGPLAALARLIGLPGASSTGGLAALSAGGTISGAALGANHVAALVAAAIATAGGAVGLEHVIATSGHTHRGTAARSSTYVGAAGSPAALAGSYAPQAGAGAASSSAPYGESTAGAGQTGPAAGNPSGTAGAGATAGGQSVNGPTPTAPPGWGSTGPPPTVRPSPGDTGPTPTSAGGDGSSGSPTPSTDGTGAGAGTGDSSGASGSTSAGGTTTSAGGSTGTSTGTSSTGTGTSTTGDPGATTAAAGSGSTGTGQSTATSTSSSGAGT